MAKRKRISGKKRKVTDYQNVQKKVAKRCANPTAANEEAVDKAKKKYIKSAVKKGKTKKEATRIANDADTCTPIRQRKKRRR